MYTFSVPAVAQNTALTKSKIYNILPWHEATWSHCTKAGSFHPIYTKENTKIQSSSVQKIKQNARNKDLFFSRPCVAKQIVSLTGNKGNILLSKSNLFDLHKSNLLDLRKSNMLDLRKSNMLGLRMSKKLDLYMRSYFQHVGNIISRKHGC